jgi:hypothetical protein
MRERLKKAVAYIFRGWDEEPGYTHPLMKMLSLFFYDLLGYLIVIAILYHIGAIPDLIEDVLNLTNEQMEKLLPDTLTPDEKQGAIRSGFAPATIIAGRVHKAVKTRLDKGLFQPYAFVHEEEALKRYAYNAGILFPQ